MPATHKYLWLYMPAIALTCFLPFFIGIRKEKAFSVIQFETTTISFDTIQAGQKIAGEYKFKNTGDDTLHIFRVQAGDGGTIVHWPDQPIMPGAKGEIKVEFGFTAARRGFQDKLFTVISNAQNYQVLLRWKGYIRQ